MDREGEVRLAAAEVDHAQRPLGPQRGNDVVDKLQEAVDLPKLVVAALAHLAVRRHHAELDQERDGRSLLEQVSLPPVVLPRRSLSGRRPAEHGFPEHLPIGLRGLKQTLPVVAEQRAETLACRIGSKVLVRGAVRKMRGEAVCRLAAQLDRIDRRLGRNLGRAGLREHGAAQLIAREEIGQELFERRHLRHQPPRAASARSRSASGRTGRRGRAARAAPRRRRRSSPRAASRRPRRP